MRTRDSSPEASDVILKQRFSETTATTTWLLFALVLLVPCFLIAYIFVAHFPEGRAPTEWSGWADALSAFWQLLLSELPYGPTLQTIFMFVLSVPVLYLLVIILPKQRLIISAETLEWRVPVPRWLEFVKSGWTLNLAEVTRATLKSVPFGAEGAVTLEIEASGRKRLLQPAFWIEASTPAEGLSLLGSFDAVRRRPDRARLLSTPLCAALLRAGVTVDGLEERAGSGTGLNFDLGSNDATRLVGFAIVGLLCYGIADTMLNAEEYVTGPPLRWLVGTGCLAAAFALSYLLKSQAPVLVAVTLCAILGAVSAGASSPAILRINAATDTQGLQTVTYHRVLGSRFEPLEESGWPPVSLPEPGYWLLQPEGIERRIEIRLGGLGLYQVRLENIRAELRDYFRNR